MEIELVAMAMCMAMATCTSVNRLTRTVQSVAIALAQQSSGRDGTTPCSKQAAANEECWHRLEDTYNTVWHSTCDTCVGTSKSLPSWSLSWGSESRAPAAGYCQGLQAAVE
jgi:hypothetical protein